MDSTGHIKKGKRKFGRCGHSYKRRITGGQSDKEVFVMRQPNLVEMSMDDNNFID
jgi:hypothetical protein